jgi:hypothetical protein
VWTDASVLLKNGVHALVIEQVFNRWCRNALGSGVEFMVSGTKKRKKKGTKGEKRPLILVEPVAHHTTLTACNGTS